MFASSVDTHGQLYHFPFHPPTHAAFIIRINIQCGKAEELEQQEKPKIFDNLKKKPF